MNRSYITFGCGAFALALVGCGPLSAPLPPRLEDEQQKAVNDSWDKTLSPVNRFDNQGLLDVLMTCNTYQLGVDKLEFRSEKSFAGGVVVMEVRFDRSATERDLFSVTVNDQQGKVLRQERYNREQIEATHRDLIIEPIDLQKKRQQGAATPEELKKLADVEARRARVNTVMPVVPVGPPRQAEEGDKAKK